MDRRYFLKQLLVGGVGLTSLAVAEGLVREPYRPVVEHVTIGLPRLPESFDGTRIVLMGDFHFGPYIGKDQIQNVVRIARSLRPHLVLLTGDFVSHPLFGRNGPAGARHAEPCSEILKQLKDVPIVTVLGNHDHWNGADLVEEILENNGISVLRNRSVPFDRDGHRLWLVGVDDVYERANDFDRALSSVPSSEFKIVVVHEPDFADVTSRHDIDLQLSGHSHGGQVWIPGIGAPILPPLGKKYPRGLYRVGPLQLYTNRGIGVVSPPVRMNCCPEITLVTLVARTSPPQV